MSHWRIGFFFVFLSYISYRLKRLIVFYLCGGFHCLANCFGVQEKAAWPFSLWPWIKLGYSLYLISSTDGFKSKAQSKPATWPNRRRGLLQLSIQQYRSAYILLLIDDISFVLHDICIDNSGRTQQLYIANRKRQRNSITCIFLLSFNNHLYFTFLATNNNIDKRFTRVTRSSFILFYWYFGLQLSAEYFFYFCFCFCFCCSLLLVLFNWSFTAHFHKTSKSLKIQDPRLGNKRK